MAVPKEKPRFSICLKNPKPKRGQHLLCTRSVRGGLPSARRPIHDASAPHVVQLRCDGLRVCNTKDGLMLTAPNTVTIPSLHSDRRVHERAGRSYGHVSIDPDLYRRRRLAVHCDTREHCPHEHEDSALHGPGRLDTDSAEMDDALHRYRCMAPQRRLHPFCGATCCGVRRSSVASSTRSNVDSVGQGIGLSGTAGAKTGGVLTLKREGPRQSRAPLPRPMRCQRSHRRR